MIVPPDNSSLYRSSEGYQGVMGHYDTTLQRMVVPYEIRYVQTRFGPTHMVISGKEKGKPVVLWHGQDANAASWTHWIPALALTDRIYAVDVIGGMGRSGSNERLSPQRITQRRTFTTWGVLKCTKMSTI